MKNWFPAAIGLLVTFVALIIFSVFNPSSNDEEHTITVPQYSTEENGDTTDIGMENKKAIEMLTIDRTNIQSIISLIDRPESYSARISIEYYFIDGATRFVDILSYKLGQMSKVVHMQRNAESVATVILTEDNYYIWDVDGENSYTGKAGDFTETDIENIPSYEHLAEIDPEDITYGDVRMFEGDEYIYLVSKSDITGYESEWYISISTGLLTKIAVSDNGRLIYNAVLTVLNMDEPDIDLFMLPNGSMPE